MYLLSGAHLGGHYIGVKGGFYKVCGNSQWEKVQLGGLVTYTAIYSSSGIYLYLAGFKEVCSPACEAYLVWHGSLPLVIIGQIKVGGT